MATTNIQKEKSIRKGSVRILAGLNVNALVDIGAVRNPVFSSLAENQEIVLDNTDPIKTYNQGNKVQFTFDLAEINFSNLAVLDGGLVTVTEVAGSAVSDHQLTIDEGDWSYETFIALDHQNANGSKPTVDSVTGGTNGALTVNDDYFVTKVGNQWGIVVRDGTNTDTESQNLVIQYDYTPAQSKTVTFNVQGTKTNCYLRVVNEDANSSETLQFDMERATNTTPISIDFASDTEADVAISSITMEGYIVNIVDEQQVT